MRRIVMVKKWYPDAAGNRALQDFKEAYFHMFAQNSEMLPEGIADSPVAIVEYKDTGEVDMVFPTYITFIGVEK